MSGKRLNPFQHALLRPENYIGPVKTQQRECWVFDSSGSPKGLPLSSTSDEGEEVSKETGSENSGVIDRIVNKTINYNPGLERIIVEIKSNIEDNKWRSQEAGIAMKRIEVDVDLDPNSETYGWFTFTNDGKHIPVAKEKYDFVDHRTGNTVVEELYPAQLFFGEMLAGTNFEGDATRKTSGRNGIGSKAANIFSKHFTVTHFDPVNSMLFTQKYHNNATVREPPVITKQKGKLGYTTISFLPDYEYFKYTFDNDLVSLVKKHLYDTAMITGIPVVFNGEKIAVKNLESYVRLYFPSKENELLYFTASNGDECVIIESDDYSAASKPRTVSFINGIYTKDGGVHVDAWTSKIFPFIVEAFNSRKTKKGEEPLKATKDMLYPYFVVFVRSEVNAPEFESQSKNELVKPEIKLCEKQNEAAFNKSLREAVEKTMKWDFVELIEERLAFELDAKLSRKEKKETKSISLGNKGSDANEAGKKEAEKCTLYITEGSSARSFANTLICKDPSKKGKDYYGSVEIRGKFINVTNSTMRVVSANKEVQLLKKMIGLSFGVDYSVPEFRSKLRYGRVCILTDADDDGIHIQGLLLNFFYKFWPSLYEKNPACGGTSNPSTTGPSTTSNPSSGFPYFITALSTAVTIVGEKKLFYTNPDFKKWATTVSSSQLKGTRYLKGLGSHRPGDHSFYLKDPQLVSFTLSEDHSEKKAIELGFDGSFSNQRKKWITALDTDELTVVNGDVALSKFIDKKLVIYCRMVLFRALPSMFDGLKSSQLKSLFGIMKALKKANTSTKVTVLTGQVTSLTKYHHGAVSLSDTIIKMAAGYVGSNNIPLLVNDGHFGTRCGDKAAAARYIDTCIEPVTRKIFREEDDCILKYNFEEGEQVECENYFPIIPMILVNGAEGIACGFSTTIPNFNPEDLVSSIKKWLGDKEYFKTAPHLVPWYRGFNGTNTLIEKNGVVTGWVSRGKLEQSKGKKWWDITETPVGLKTYDLKEWIEYLRDGTPPEGKKWKKTDGRFIKEYRDISANTNSVHYQILPSSEFTPDIDTKGNFNILLSNHTLTNIVALDENFIPRKFNSINELFEVWCEKRLKCYDQRREYVLKSYVDELKVLQSKFTFLSKVISKEIDPGQPKAQLVSAIEKSSQSIIKIDGTYDYLCNLPIGSLTKEKMDDINALINSTTNEYTRYKKLTSEVLWKQELDEFLVAYKKFLTTRNDSDNDK